MQKHVSNDANAAAPARLQRGNFRFVPKMSKYTGLVNKNKQQSLNTVSVSLERSEGKWEK